MMVHILLPMAMMVGMLVTNLISTECTGTQEHEDHFGHSVHGAELASQRALSPQMMTSPEEQRVNIYALVDMIDVSGDRVITRDELLPWVTKSLKKHNDDESEKKMAEDDVNGDGMLSWAEYAKSSVVHTESNIISNNSNATMDRESVLMLEDSLNMDRQRFAAADVSGDERLNVSEYAAFLRPYDYSHMAAYEMDRALTDMDANGDDAIDEEEYFGDIIGVDSDLLAEEGKIFAFNDRNGDGHLSGEELHRWVSHDISMLALEETNGLFEETDTNGDGRLTEDEIMVQYDLWLVSGTFEFHYSMPKDEL